MENQASIVSPDNDDSIDSQGNIIRQLQLANLQDFLLVEFLSISFTHHICILENAKDTDERLFYIRYCHNYKPNTDELPGIIKQQDLYHHQGNIPNNFLATLPDFRCKSANIITDYTVKIIAGEHRVRDIHRTLHSKIKKTGYGEKSSQ